MAKTITDLFGDGAVLEERILTIDYYSLLQIIGASRFSNSPNPSPEAFAFVLLLALNQTTKYAIDDDGFAIVNSAQAVVSPNTDVRRNFVTREGVSQVRTSLNFELYSEDTSKFEADSIAGYSPS